MKKYLLLITVLLLSQFKYAGAQTLTVSPDSLFLSPDTVCINQLVTILPDTASFGASSYYWGFCSGYLANAPTGTNEGSNFDFHDPSAINIADDSGTYYGFVLNARTSEFLRLNFGNSLTNVPTVTNFGNLGNGLPVNPTSLFILQDTLTKNWYIYVTGGYNTQTSSIGRIDFGRHLNNNTPNVANFGNYDSLLNYPVGIFVAQDPSNFWYGYVVNHADNKLIRLDFSFNESNTPQFFDYGNAGGNLQNPTDLAAVYDKGDWYLFITNEGLTSWVTRVGLGGTLAPDPTVVNDPTQNVKIANNGTPPDITFNTRILQPSSITITRDCGDLYAYITDSTSSQLIGIQMTTVTGPYYAVDYNNVGAQSFPSSISSVLRSGDNLNGFIVNPGDSTLSLLDFNACHNSSIPSYSEVRPPAYQYDSPGVYNIYLVINQGQPNMRVDCKPITVLPYPPIYINNDTTICQGDTAILYAISVLADSFAWQSSYNIDTSNIYQDSVKVFPAYSTKYPVVIYYPFGCIVDTSVYVNVRNVTADAGPDRYISDGASTMLGGPYTTLSNYIYHWSPFQYMNDSLVPNPIVRPPSDFTYYLTVTDSNGCTATDDVTVFLNCGNFYVPNAFAPNSENPLTNRFSILNSEIKVLNYFRVYDRWGVEMFETTDPTQGWDGTFNNKPQPVGVYVYEIDGFCTSGRRITKKGNVTLLR